MTLCNSLSTFVIIKITLCSPYYFLAPAYHTSTVNVSDLLDISLKSKIALLDLTEVASLFQVIHSGEMKSIWLHVKLYRTSVFGLILGIQGGFVCFENQKCCW